MKRKEPIDPKRAAYRRSLSAAVLRHARYLAVRDDKSATQHLVDRRLKDWQRMEGCKSRLQAEPRSPLPITPIDRRTGSH